MASADLAQPAAAEMTKKTDGATRVLLALLVAVVALVAAAFVLGPVVLTLAALVLVPVMFAFFFAVSRP